MAETSLAQAVASAIEGPPAWDLEPGELAGIRQRLRAALGGLPAGREVTIGAYALDRLVACPASDGEPFEWSAPLAARRVALQAIGFLRDRRHRAADAVTLAMEQSVDYGGALGAWLASLGPDERLTVAAAAMSWAARVWPAVPEPMWGELRPVQDQVRAKPADGTVLLGRVDARVWRRHGGELRPVFVTFGRPSTATIRFSLLVGALSGGREPWRMVVVDPSTATVRVEETSSVALAAAADQVVEVAQLLAVDVPEARPHAGCRWCWRVDAGSCTAGAAWLEAASSPGTLPG